MFRQIKSLIAAAVTLSGSAVGSVWSRLGGLGIGSRLRFLLPGSRFDYEREAGDLWANSIIAICLKWAGDNFPRPRITVSKVLRDGTKVEIPNHRMLSLIRRPNKHYSWRTLAKAIVLSLVCDGNCYLVKIRNGFKQPVALYWVPHWLMQPVWPEDGSVYIRCYQFLRDYEVVEIAAADVIHFRDGIDPRNDRLGLASMKAQLREITTDNEISGYTATIMRNCGVPGLVVIPKNPSGKIDKDIAERVKGKLKDSLGGENRGEAAVFSEQIEITQLGFSPEKLRIDRLGARGEARICAAAGLSPMTVGLPDPNKTYANFAEANSAGWRHCLVPLGELVNETFQWQLLPEFDDPDKHIVGSDYSQVEALQEDLASKHKRVRDDWKAGLVTHAQACTLLGYEVDPDGDRYYPSTVADAGTPPAGDLPRPGAASQAPDDPEDDDETEDDGETDDEEGDDGDDDA